MVSLRKTLETSQALLDAEGISYALIGGFALASHGVARATQDIDLLIDGARARDARRALEAGGFKLVHESDEVQQYTGVGYLDLLFARRPLSLEMLSAAQVSPTMRIKVIGPEDLIGLKIQAYKNDVKREFKDKADIQLLIEKSEALDWDRIKKYADLFGEWPTVVEMRRRVQK